MNEIWRDVAGYEGLYQVSSLGRVRSFHKDGRVLKPGSKEGYLFVNLYRKGNVKNCKIHRLVAAAFISNPLNKPEVNHIDGNPSNNHADNLEWATRAENQRHAVATGLKVERQGEARHNSKLTNKQAEFIRDNPDNLTGRQLAEKFGTVQSIIYSIQLGKTYRNAGGTIHKPKHTLITEEIRREIRRLYKKGVRGCGVPALARKFGLGETTIRRIVNNQEE